MIFSRIRSLLSLLPALLLITACATSPAPTATPVPSPTPLPQVVSAQTLADEYGLNVFLVAVTAANGLIDLRVKIVDAEKAATLLQTADDYPLLQTADGSILYPATEPPLHPELEDGAVLFAMFPNSENAVSPGDPVGVIFGDVALEPVTAQ
ncbi:MAG: hypothetical protein R2873_25110 [Caldilineaceae bacterium]